MRFKSTMNLYYSYHVIVQSVSDCNQIFLELLIQIYTCVYEKLNLKANPQNQIHVLFKKNSLKKTTFFINSCRAKQSNLQVQFNQYLDLFWNTALSRPS